MRWQVNVSYVGDPENMADHDGSRRLDMFWHVLAGLSANRKLSCFHGGISPVKSACGKLEAPLAFAGDCRRVTGYRNNRPEPSASSATPAWHDLWALWSLDGLTLPPILKVEPT